MVKPAPGTRPSAPCSGSRCAPAGFPYQLFDSSTGFRLPDGSVLSLDTALVSQKRWQALTAEQRRGFPPLCPDLVVELASAGDEGPRGLSALRRKMAPTRPMGSNWAGC